MPLWRICRKPFADLTGIGAKLYGGRWNSPGRPVLYTAETAALAVLEVRVHLGLDYNDLPVDYVLLEIDLGGAAIEQAPPTALADALGFGDDWLVSQRSAALRVPSVIVPESANVLVNPEHPDAAGLAIVSERAFQFDKRLWTDPPSSTP